MSKHTPGPWFPQKHEEGYGVRFTPHGGSSSWWVADVIGSQPDGFSDEANAHLISAAPDLLEALEIWLADYDEVAANPDFEPFPHAAERVAKTRAAIAKAKGETK